MFLSLPFFVFSREVLGLIFCLLLILLVDFLVIFVRNLLHRLIFLWLFLTRFKNLHFLYMSAWLLFILIFFKRKWISRSRLHWKVYSKTCLRSSRIITVLRSISRFIVLFSLYSMNIFFRISWWIFTEIRIALIFLIFILNSPQLFI